MIVNEIIVTMMNFKNGIIIRQHHQVMMMGQPGFRNDRMKNNPGMMYGMLSGMIKQL